MIYTLTTMRSYVRDALDNRLADSIKYSDTWVDTRIEEGLAIAQDIKQTLFYTKEKYNIETNLTVDMLTAVEIIPQREVHTVWAVEYDTNALTLEITANNHVVIRRIENAPLPTDYNVTVRYFFYHTLPFTQVEMSMEVYKLVKYCIAIACFQYLQDKESEQYFTSLAESMVVKSTFDIEKKLMDVPEERLWMASWA